MLDRKPLHGGKLAAKALKNAGVEVVFTLSGGHIMPLYDGCIDEGIKIVDVRHEQAAVHAADAWARCNPGKIGVAAITAGPGVTDGVTGIANAWRANSPILVIGGQGPFENLRRGSLQEMDHLGVVRPITKYCDAIYQTKRIPEYIELAIRHAVSGIPGPSFLEIPMDIFMGSVDEEDVVIPRIRTEPPRLSPDQDEVRTCPRAAPQGAAPDADGGDQREVVEGRRRHESLHQRDPHPDLHERDGPRLGALRFAGVPESLAARCAEEARPDHPGRDAARFPHALRPDDSGRREDHPARNGRDADRPEPPDRRAAGRQSRLQLPGAVGGDEEPERAPRFLGLARSSCARSRTRKRRRSRRASTATRCRSIRSACAARCATGSIRSRTRS